MFSKTKDTMGKPSKETTATSTIPADLKRNALMHSSSSALIDSCPYLAV